MAQSFIKELNRFMKYGTARQKEDLKREISPTRRQTEIYDSFYIAGLSVVETARELGYSEDVIHRELKTIRTKIRKVWKTLPR